ncbi:hypothetical protein EDD86DRAFT_76889 [Gorgonomyces haynaldii]|nr:hypothetical protein EDD86DRAFT_76889 [Gorgonomyces haynaldii]
MGSFREIDPVNCCSNIGVTCSADALTGLYINNAAARKPIPESRNLKSLESQSHLPAEPLPKALMKMTNLKALDLSVAIITDISVILSMTWLESVDLSAAGLKGPVLSFSNFKDLKKLILKVNKFTSVGRLDLPALEILALSSNNLTGSLPDLSLLPNIQELYAQKNGFTSFGKDYENARNLQKIDISENPNLYARLPSLSSVTACNVTDTPFCSLTDKSNVCGARPCFTPSLRAQCMLISEAYFAMGGDPPGLPGICCFNGVSRCNAENVTKIDLSVRGLSGPTPKSLFQLNLEELILYATILLKSHRN